MLRLRPSRPTGLHAEAAIVEGAAGHEVTKLEPRPQLPGRQLHGGRRLQPRRVGPRPRVGPEGRLAGDGGQGVHSGHLNSFMK